MNGELLIELLRDFGFPVVVATWFMLRTDGLLLRVAVSLEKLVGSADELAQNHDRIYSRLDDVSDRLQRIQSSESESGSE